MLNTLLRCLHAIMEEKTKQGDDETTRRGPSLNIPPRARSIIPEEENEEEEDED